MKNRKKFLLTLAFIAALFVIVFKTIESKRIFLILGSDLEVRSPAYERFTLIESDIWQGINGIYTGDMHSFGLDKEMLESRFEVNFFLHDRSTMSGTIYAININDYDQLENYRETPENNSKPDYENFYNKLLGEDVVLEINGRYIKFDQIFYDRLGEEMLSSRHFDNSSF